MLEKIKNFPKQWLYLLGIFLLFIVIGILYFSYALFTSSVEKGGTLNIITGEFSYAIKSEDLTGNQITVESGKTKIFTLEIENTNDRDTSYAVYYNMKSPSSMPSGLKVGYGDITVDPVKGELISKGQQKKVELVIENKSNVPVTIEIGVQGGLIGRELTVTKGSLISEKITSALASAPELASNMIPVKYNESTNTWVKADITNPESNPWYNYNNKMWANAVTTDQNKVLDLSGNNRNGIIRGAAITSGLGVFDGVDDLVEVGLQNYFFGKNASLVIRTTLESKNWVALLGNWEVAGFGIEFDGANNFVRAALYGDTSNRYFVADFSLVPEANRYYTIVATYDGLNLKLYIDGELKVSTPVTDTIRSSTQQYMIGANPSPSLDYDAVDYAKMKTTNVAIFQKTLTVEEIRKDYANSVNIIDSTKLLVNYDFKKGNDIVPNSPISMDATNGMYVWIPRYRYALPTGTGAREISIRFEDKATVKSTGTATGTSYLTHPAFTFGTKELNGIWVGKFETGGLEQNLTIKPNIQSFTNKTVSEFFTLSRNMQASGNVYGFSSSKMNTHMMKNSEWGAVSYLTQSKYGRCTGGVCEEVMINNTNANGGRSITGCAADTVTAPELVRPDCPETNRYQTEKGVKASTTGNIYGIYDMSGGSWEYVMGNYNKYSGYTAISYTAEQAKTILGRSDNVAIGIWNSGFNGPVYGKALDGITNLSWTSGIPFPEQKYYDLYTTNSAQTACNGKVCLGHGLSEVAGWNSDYSDFISSASQWFLRGGSYGDGVGAGVFVFSNYYGDAYGFFSFRLTITDE